MSTNDVPGANPIHNDVLAMGCWAEHDDGSLIYVQSAEGGRIVYQMFDLSEDPIVEYRDAMPEQGFKKTFSWDASDPDSEKWTWHDKTPFPWGRVIQHGAKDGVHHASAHDLLSAAARVATSLKTKGREYKKGIDDHMMDIKAKGPVRNRIIDKVQSAIDRMRA